jgi:hypothetical protein
MVWGFEEVCLGKTDETHNTSKAAHGTFRVGIGIGIGIGVEIKGREPSDGCIRL